MKSTTLFLGSLLATAAIAQPHRGHLAKHHQHQKPKREDAVAWVTEWVTETDVVGYTTTIWVSEGDVAPTSSASPTTTSAITSSNVPAQFFQGATKPASTTSSTSVYVAPVPTSTSTSTSVYVAPTTSTTPVYVAPVETSSTYVAPVVETTSSYVAPVVATTAVVAPVVETTAAPVVVPTTTAVAVAVAVPTTTSAAAAVATSSSETAGGCTSGSPCAGEITHYDTVGLGACGYTDVDGDAENVVAMPVGLMGPLSNSNPMCGLYITVKSTKTGKHTTARVVDKCMGCLGNSIDLGNKAFAELDDMGVGREDATWWWN